MGAIISECGLYRYELDRPGKTGEGSVLWVMLNPSTADAKKDDATIIKCRGFIGRWGFRDFTVVNLFAYRATNPRELMTVEDPLGPDNLFHLEEQCDQHDLVVFAWGANMQNESYLTVEKLVEWYPEAVCLGLTKKGCPKHPLYIRYDTELELFR
jgi:hypothetical protein